ncbi:alpha/beta-hydrolase [Karstenula rhodostoma CBS 690.94]|uniref:Carboxylic ester hydrolase n=1 Tax=Karstenula rhodostoma CBS 690.94 TaxID=1392251 RepID=A0A9P4P7H6_9PLEO|nr:alpha/beta-hydrolase [Karstenula rhodostoma CBS 690.94]
MALGTYINRKPAWRQLFALQWVQAYIELFGGDPSRVTISGESAGAGSVMLLDIAYGGTLGTSLFVNSITASPYLPQQYHYKDWVPSQSYYAFAIAAGCPPTWAYGNSSQTIFECLISQSTGTLQNASELVSQSGTFGSWAFLPVTDDVSIHDLPVDWETLDAHGTTGPTTLNVFDYNYKVRRGLFFNVVVAPGSQIPHAA